MNDELKQKLIEALGDLHDTIAKGVVFAQDQAPLVVQEYLRFAFWSNVLGIVVGLGFIVLPAYIRRRLLPWADSEGGYDRQDRRMALIIMVIIGSAIGTIVTITASIGAMKYWLAPRVVILEWLGSLIRGG